MPDFNDNPMYYEQQCNIYGCDFGPNPDPDDNCSYCFGPQPKEEAE